MRIFELYLKNFRNVADDRFRFPKNFTVIIGVNGKGKSTILHGLRVACGAFFLGIPEVKRRHILPSEIRQVQTSSYLAPQLPVIVEVEGALNGQVDSLRWRRTIAEGSTSTSSSNADVGNVRDFGAAKFDQMRHGGESGDHLDLPVIAYFGTSRAYGAARNRGSRIGRQIFVEGYHSWFEMQSPTYGYRDWLEMVHLRERGQGYEGEWEIFHETMLKANPDLLEFRFIGREPWVAVKIEEERSQLMPISLHSDGVRSYTEMVAELAYRCIVMNGYKRENAVKETRGVVMIDELDLHLHPNWQKHVVADLQAAFPKIQFIATTHSPFIVQSLEAGEIISLDRIVDVNPSSLSLEDVAEAIMGVESSYSLDNQMAEKISREYLETLENMGARDDSELSNIYGVLDTLESQISDPAVRAFLKMQRLKYQK